MKHEPLDVSCQLSEIIIGKEYQNQYYFGQAFLMIDFSQGLIFSGWSCMSLMGKSACPPLSESCGILKLTEASVIPFVC